MSLSLSQLLLAIWLILIGLTWMTWVAIGQKFLGIWAFVTGIVWLIEGYHPVTVWQYRGPNRSQPVA